MQSGSLEITNAESQKSSIPVTKRTRRELDSLRPVYGDGSKESWDHFLNRIAHKLKQEA